MLGQLVDGDDGLVFPSLGNMSEKSDYAAASTAKSPRIFLSIRQQGLAPEELNQLFSQSGLPVRPPDKLAIALQHSLFCITARTFKEKSLVGFVRATSDGVFNITVWDLVVMPALPNPKAIAGLLMARLQREAVKVVPNCAISAFANPQDQDWLHQMNFSEDHKGIRAMILASESDSQANDRLKASATGSIDEP